MAEFFGMKYLQDRGLTLGGPGVANLLDGLNDMKILKGVLSCLDLRHHPDD